MGLGSRVYLYLSSICLVGNAFPGQQRAILKPV
jgi:hypothetical protein